MDYAYYATQTQPYQFSGFPPTPSHSYEPHDDQSGDAPDLYQGANGFTGYDAHYQFSADGFLPPEAPHVPTPQPQTQQPQQPSPNSTYQASVGSVSQQGDAVGGVQQVTPIGAEFDTLERQGSRSDSEEKESSMTPQQSRRKAQNRAAQRAFRERKERHVKELETKLNSLSAHSSSLLSDNERLKRELQRLATQNEILKATTQQQQAQVDQVRQQQQNVQPRRSPSPVHGPQTYSPTDFSAAVGVDLHMHPLSYDKYDGDGGQRLLAAGAAWDFIQAHPLFLRGQVDVADVSRRLHGKAACNGRGPVFQESQVMQAIEESVLSSSDELI